MITVISHDLLAQGDVSAILESTGSEYVHVNSKATKVSVINLGMSSEDFQNFSSAHALNIFSKDFTPETIQKLGSDICVISNGSLSAHEFETVTDKIKTLLGKLPIIGIGVGKEILEAASDSNTTWTHEKDISICSQHSLYGFSQYSQIQTTHLL